MKFYNNEKNVKQYIEMTNDYQNDKVMNFFLPHLKNGSTILELGMGPGKDMDILKENFKVTGSDSSQVFLDLYRDKDASIPLLKLDAATIEVDNKFDCIYSNKVLQHLTKEELVKSIKRQTEVLETDGIVFHTFWYGEGVEEYNGLLFSYYNVEELSIMFEEGFEIIEMGKYCEDSEGDSIYIVAKVKSE